MRGLCSASKQQQLARDMDAYRIDFCGLQELKMTTTVDKPLGDSHRFVSFGQAEGRHGGNGFVISNMLNKFVSTFKKISDRVGTVDLSIPQGKGNTLPVRFVVAYGPTNPAAQSNPEVRERFYDALSTAWNKCSGRTLVIGLGDFNSKVGAGEAACVGQYGKGVRNDNGQALVEWANMHHLVLANTLFRYSMRYRTTWTGCMASPDGLRKMIHNMIDYIVIPKRYKPLVVRARSYAGTETFSDHKIVIADMELTGLYRVHIAAAGKAAAPIAIQRLENADVRKEYQSSLCQKLREQPAFCGSSDSGSVISTWDSTAQAVMDVAESTLGRMHRSGSRRVCVPNPEVETLSRRQREIRLLQQSGHHNPEELKRERNCIMHQIRNIQRSDAMERLDRIAERVEKAPTSAQMFTAAAQLKSGSGQ